MITSLNMNTSAPLHEDLAEPALIPFLLGQSPSTQEALAKELRTTQQRLSRVANGKAELRASEFSEAAPHLALGKPTDEDWRDERKRPIPGWVITRWHASALIEPPPVTPDGKVPVFLNFAEAALVVDYLRCFSRAGVPVAVPVWRAWLHESLEARGLDKSVVQMLIPPGDADGKPLQRYMDQFDDVQRGLLRVLLRRGM